MTALVTRLLGGGGRLSAPATVIGWEADTGGIIRVSRNTDRSGSVSLHGAVLDMTVPQYPYTSSGGSAAVATSNFLDGNGLGGDTTAPFDIIGTVAGVIQPFPALADGSHTVGVICTLANGTTRNLLATFSVTADTEPEPDPGGLAWLPDNPREALGIRLSSVRTGTKFKDYMDWVDPSPASPPGRGKYHLIFLPSKDAHVNGGAGPISWAKALEAAKLALGTSSSSMWYENGRPMDVTCILTTMLVMDDGETLAGQANGDYPLANAFVDDLMDWLIANGWNANWPDGRPKVVISWGWEPNGDWFRWSILTAAGAANYKKAVDRFHARMVARATAAGQTMNIWFATAPTVGGKIDKSIMKAAIPSTVKIIGLSVYDTDAGYTNKATQELRDAHYVATVRARFQRGYVRSAYTGVGYLDVSDWAAELGIYCAIHEGGVSEHEDYGHDNLPFYTDLRDWIQAQCTKHRFIYHAFTEEVDGLGDHRLRGSGADGTATGSLWPRCAAFWLEEMDTNPDVPIT